MGRSLAFKHWPVGFQLILEGRWKWDEHICWRYRDLRLTYLELLSLCQEAVGCVCWGWLTWGGKTVLFCKMARVHICCQSLLPRHQLQKSTLHGLCQVDATQWAPSNYLFLFTSGHSSLILGLLNDWAACYCITNIFHSWWPSLYPQHHPTLKCRPSVITCEFLRDTKGILIGMF